MAEPKTGAGKRYRVSPPVDQLPELLPLHDPNLPWDRFEAFCRSLVACLPSVVTSHHFGKRGDAQQGIDLVAELSDGSKWVYQCRQRRSISGPQFRKAVKETTYLADRYFFLMSCEATAQVREAADEIANWEVWDARDIAAAVRGLPIDSARKLVETHFGKAWRRAFLGLRNTEALVSAQAFFAPLMRKDHLFNHTWSMVGRTQTLEELKAFADSAGSSVAVLQGRGGIGKSKVLQAFAEDADEGLTTRFLLEGMPVTPETLDEAPEGGCTVIVDDAHRRDDLVGLLAWAKVRADRTKLILSIRPYGSDRISALLSEVGFDTREVVWPQEIKEMDQDDVVSLAKQALGKDLQYLADQLALATADCPLVTVVGGQLLATRQLQTELLESDEEFRQTVLTKFRDVLVGQFSHRIPEQACRALLELISAVSPVRVNGELMLDRIAENLDIRRPRLIEMLGILEEAGVLVRRGYALRITPDVLGDHILSRASLTPQGQVTGYADEVWQSFRTVCPSEVMQNLAELDWRVRSGAGNEQDLLVGIWNSVEREFRESDHRGRERLLGMLEHSAYYQANRVLRLIEDAVQHPASERLQETDSPYQLTHHDVLRRIPAVLRRISFVLEYLSRCCDLLWRIGRHDQRPLNQFPDHPIRVLQDLASFEPAKPLEFNQIVVDTAANWLNDEEAFAGAHSPLDVIEPLLAKTGYTTQSSGHKIVFTPFLVHERNTRALRNQVLDILRRTATSADLKASLRAIKSLQEALRNPGPAFSQKIDEKDRRAWIPGRRAILDMMQVIAANTTEPLVQLELAEAARWHARHGSTKGIKARAQAVLDSVPDSYALRLTRFLKRSWDHDWEPRAGEDTSAAYRRHEGEMDSLRGKVARQFRARNADAESAVSELGTEISKITTAAGGADSWRFIKVLADGDAVYAGQVCGALIAKPDVELAPYFSYFLASFRSHDRTAAVRLANRALQTRSLSLGQAVAHSYTWDGWAEDASRAELKLIESLFATSDTSRIAAALHAVAALGRSRPRAAIGIIIRADLGDSSHVANQLGMILEPGFGISPDRLSDRNIDQILSKLEAVTEIDDHSLVDFLKYSAGRRPTSLVNMLLNRVKRGDSSGADFTPLPYLGFGTALAGLSKAKEYEGLLRNIRDCHPLGAAGRTFWLPKLYRDASGNFGSVGLKVLEEQLLTADSTAVERASRLLRDAERDVVLEKVEFVSRVLTNAHELGDDTLRTVEGHLYAAAISGTSSGTPGQPMPRDLELRDRASAIAEDLAVTSPAHRFYSELGRAAEEHIRDQLARDEELED